MFKIEYHEKIIDENLKNQIWDILCQCDKEFIPPLSSRNSSSQKKLSNLIIGTQKPVDYFNKMIDQHFVLAFNQSEEIAGFMTFIHNYICEELSHIGDSNYITTACVRKKERNKGILKRLYSFIENDLPKKYRMKYISTRTWSINQYHLKTLKSRGYAMGTILKNHRGKGIDTIYFYKKIL